MRSLLNSLAAGVVFVAGGYFAQDKIFKGEAIKDPWLLIVEIVLVVGVVTWLATSKSVRDAITQTQWRRPKLTMADPRVETAAFQMGAQPWEINNIATVTIHNARESGGERATAKNVLPEIEITDLNGEQLFRHKGWDVSTPLDFTPRQEEHALYIAEKPQTRPVAYGVRGTPSGYFASGNQLPQAGFCVRITLRGDNIKPHRQEFHLENEGAGGGLRFREL
jgi:hypothetical protein